MAANKLDELLERYGYETPPEDPDEREDLGRRFSNFQNANRERAKQMEARQEEFLNLLTLGEDTISNICKKMGISRHTYERWRRDDADFRRRADAIKMGLLDRKESGESPQSFDGTFTHFRKEFFGWDTYYHQREIIRAIEGAQPGEIVMVLCPPEHGKTTVLEDYINFKLGVNPDFRITYVHESNDFAKRVLRRVSQRMRDTDQFGRYIARFGPFYTEGQEKSGNKPWTAQYLTVAKAEHDERDYSLQVRGWTSSVQGTRTDLLLIDDVQALKSLNQTERIAQTLRQDFFSRPGAKGRIVMVGTRVGVGDIYEHFLADEGLRDLIKLVQLPALDGDGNPLCPEMWSSQALELKRKLVGEEAWWRNYQQAPLSSGSQTFSASMIEEAKDEEIAACAVTRGEPVVLSLDPALGGGNALLAASYGKERLNLIDLRLDYGLGRTEDIIAGIYDFAVRYHPQDVVIESVAFQRGLARDDRLRKLAKQMGFRIREHATHNNKTDPILGVSSMASSFIRTEIRIPWGTQLAASRFDDLIAELLSWRPDVPTKLLKQDTVMALWFAWKFWMEKRATLGFDIGAWDFDGIPWDRRH